MKATTFKKAALLAGSFGLLAGSAFSQTAVSGAGGYTTETLLNGFNLLGISLFEPVAVSGQIDSESGTTITDAGVDFVAALTDADATYVIEIIDGAQAGAVAEIASVTDANNIELTGAIGAGTANYTVRALPKLNDLFGSVATGSGFFGPTLDVVWLPDGSGGFDTYALNTTAGEFRSTTGFFLAPPKSISVFYPDGLFFENKGSSKDVVITGMVKTTDTTVAANAGFNLAATNAPVGQTFGNAGLEAFLAGGGFFGPTLDVVWLTDGSGGYNTYAYNTTASVWRTTGGFFLGDESATPLTSGMFIQRNDPAGDTAGNITVPSFYASL